MSRTTHELDDVTFAQANKVLGTDGGRDSFERAPDDVVAADLCRRAYERLRTLEGLDLGDADVLAGAWR